MDTRLATTTIHLTSSTPPPSALAPQVPIDDAARQLVCSSRIQIDHRRPHGQAELKQFGKPDEVREFPKGRVELINIGGATIGRAVFEPGWGWATSVQPLAKTKSCEAPHFQYHVSGVLRVKMDDGSEFDCGPGDVSLLPSGHDAWVVGNEPAVVVDFQGMLDYAKSR